MRLAILAGTLLIGLTALALGSPDSPATTRASTGERLTVAVLDFQADIPSSPELGKQISEALTATLSGEQGFTLVDRASMRKTLTEHEINLTGLVQPAEATQIGHLVGARILVTGKAFMLDRQLFLTAKLIGTETSLVEGVLVKGKPDADTGELLLQLSDKIRGRILDGGSNLIAKAPSPADPVPALKQKLAARKLPVIALEVVEQHIGAPRAADPPVDTELRKLLLECGFTVLEASKGNLRDAPMVVKVEAVSEFAARIGNLTSCSARVEMRLVSDEGKTLFAERVTTRAADLSEQMAAKAALQQAAHELGIKMLEFFAK